MRKKPGGDPVPYVNVRITPAATKEQKAQIIAEITETMGRVLGKAPEHTHIVIDEIAEENWGFAGVPTDVYRAQKREDPEPHSARFGCSHPTRK